MKHKHNPVWMFPSKKEVPRHRHIDLLVSRLLGFRDNVICSECGIIGHPIKSRRGGFRWHTGDDVADRQRAVDEAKAQWLGFGLSVPDVLTKFDTK